MVEGGWGGWGGRDRPGPVHSVDVTAAGAGAGDALSTAQSSQSVQLAFPMGLVRDKFTLDVACKHSCAALRAAKTASFFARFPG